MAKATESRSPRSPSSGDARRYPLPIDPPSFDDSQTDLELVAAAQGGDRRALDTLLRRHAEALHGLCRRITGNDADAADATQESLLAIVRGLGRFDGRSAFSTWAYRVATNACLDELRRRRRRPEPTDDERLDGLRADGGASSDRSIDTSSDRIDIDAALSELSPEFRAAVVLRDLLGLEYAEISEVLGIPAGTVRSRIARGRAALADRLRADGNPEASAVRPRKRL